MQQGLPDPGENDVVEVGKKTLQSVEGLQ